MRMHACMCVCVAREGVSHVGWCGMCLMSCDMSCNHARGRMYVFACVYTYAYARACARACTWRTRMHACVCVCVAHEVVSHVGWCVMCLMSCDMPCNHVRGRMYAYACVSMYAYARACARVCTWHTRMHACACVCVSYGEVSHAGWCGRCLMSCDMLG